ncbi:MAG: hypothetical protein ISS56_16470 [Anaerolineae bacterium]|nr:hypothetical protein [Anaerolineae bacterium]
MDELVKLVSEKTGLSEQMARTAVETVLGFLKDKLPGPIAAQMDNVLSGGGLGGLGDLGDLGGLAKGLGGLLGNQ